MSSCLREGQILVKRPNTTSLFAPFSSPFEDCALNPFCFFASCLSMSDQTCSVCVLLSAAVTSRLAHSRWQFEAWLHRLESMGLHRTVAVHQHWSLRRPWKLQLPTSTVKPGFHCLLLSSMCGFLPMKVRVRQRARGEYLVFHLDRLTARATLPLV